jgi:hypothetical protein
MGLIKKTNLLLAGLIGGGLYFASQYYTISGLDQVKVQSREDAPPVRDWTDPRNWIPVTHSNSGANGTESSLGSATSNRSRNSELLPAKPVTPTIRIATFDLQNYDERKTESVAVQEILVRILRNFDVIAIQGITSLQRDTLPKLFNTDRVETDRYQLYTVEDPGELIDYDPLVGWFRSKSVAPQKALTFSLVNLYLSSTRLDQEIALLPALIESVQKDGRGEDDIFLAGGFGCSDKRLSVLSQRKWGLVIQNMPTTVAGDEMLDQIAFPPQSADEFTGRAGVIDFLRKFNLTLEQATQVSTHLPVWSEFFAEEGGYPGYR